MTKNRERHSSSEGITAQKQEETRDKTILRMAMDGFYLVDTEGRILETNASYCAMIGYSTEELLTMSVKDVEVLDTQEVIEKRIQQIIGTGSARFETKHRRKDGRVIDIEASVNYLLEKQPKLFCFMRDITDRKRAEEELLYFQMAVSSATDAIGMSTPSGRHYYQNEACSRLFGLSVNEVDGVSGPPATVYADEKVGRKVFDIIMNGGSFVGEVKMLDKARKERDIYLRAYSIKNKEGKVVGLVGVHNDITEQREAQQKLRKRESQLRESQLVAKLGSWDLDLVSRTLEWSDETYLLFDKSSQHYVPSFDAFARVVHPEDRSTMESNFYKALESDATPYHVTIRVVNDSGRAWVMEAFGVVRRDSSGKALRIFGTAQDVTERKRAEEKVRQSETKYRNLFDASADGIFIMDLNGNFIDANTTAYTRLGYTKDELLALHISKLDHPEFAHKAADRMKQIHENGLAVFESAHLRKDGTAMPVEVNSRLMEYEGRTVFFSMIRDITERKKAEEALRESEKRYRILFDQSPDGILIVDPEGKILEFNDTAHSQLGYSREEFAKLRLSDIDPVESREEIQGKLLKILKMGRAAFEVRHRTKQGDIRDVYSINQTMMLSGRPVVHTIWRDVTERKKAEDVLRRSHEELEILIGERTAELTMLNDQLRNLSAHLQNAREEERTKIAREIHDDLGQSLTAIKMDLFLLRKKLPRDQKSVIEKTESMAGLIDAAIQSVKRISTELRPGILDHLGLTAAIEWQAQEFKKRSGIPCEIVFDPREMEFGKELSTAVFRIFQETLTNVARHAKATKISVLLQAQAADLLLQVKDNGKGITESEKSDPKSLGLIGIRERVNNRGGSLSIAGAPDQGTTVTVRLPLDGAGGMP